MKPEAYWSQQKLYFYAVCALFPGRLTAESLNSQQFNEYIPYYFSADSQIDELEQLKQDGLVDFTVSRIDEDSAKYSFTRVNSDAFRSLLKEYLERYCNDELVGGIGVRPDTYTTNNDQLVKYVNSSSREEPVVNPVNIWSDWNLSNSDRFPFWEVVLAFELIEASGEITALGHSSNDANSFREEARPFANVKVYGGKIKQKAAKPKKDTKHKVSIVVTPRGKLQVVIDGGRNDIWTYKSEKNDTYRAARALYNAKEDDFLARDQLGLNPDSKTQVKKLIENMRITGILSELFIEYNGKGAVRLKRKLIIDEDQYKKLLVYVKALNQKNA